MQHPTPEEKNNATEVVEELKPLPDTPSELELSEEEVNVLAARLFNNKRFLQMLAASFTSIYTNTVRLMETAAQDFNLAFEVKILDESSGDPKEFYVGYNDDDDVVFYKVVDGERITMQQPETAAKAAIVQAVKAVGAQPGQNYLALIVPRILDQAQEDANIAAIENHVLSNTKH